MRFMFITDPLTVDFGSVRPALLLARRFKELNYDVIIASSTISPSIAYMLKSLGIEILDFGLKVHFIKHMPTLEHWFKLLLNRNRVSVEFANDIVIINTSSTIMPRIHRNHRNVYCVYYAQGPMSEAIRLMKPDMPWYYKVTSAALLPLLSMLEKKIIKEFRDKSRLFIANSTTCRCLYEKLGVEVDNVIYPPLDTKFFRPSTSRPSADYVLTYAGTYGKETKYRVLKQIADRNIKIKAFGGKAHSVPSYILRHPNIEFLGFVRNEELVELYSNALYTLFVFNHEPFGYIPVESMSCGTPVLTYNKEGPSETVIHNVTGWLAQNDEELIELAINIWKNGYPQKMRTLSREIALKFDINIIAKIWLETLKSNSKK